MPDCLVFPFVISFWQIWNLYFDYWVYFILNLYFCIIWIPVFDYFDQFRMLPVLHYWIPQIWYLIKGQKSLWVSLREMTLRGWYLADNHTLEPEWLLGFSAKCLLLITFWRPQKLNYGFLNMHWQRQTSAWAKGTLISTSRARRRGGSYLLIHWKGKTHKVKIYVAYSAPIICLLKAGY